MAEERRVLHVTNITHEASEAELRDLFSIAGDIEKCVIVKEGFPYYAFIQYVNPGDARRGLNINGKSVGPSRIAVEYSRKPFPGPQNIERRIISTVRDPGQQQVQPQPGFLSSRDKMPARGAVQTVQMNLPTVTPAHEVVEVSLFNVPVNLKEHNLHQMFSVYGDISGVSLFTDASGLATGTGKVSFTSLQSAGRAAAEMDGKRLEGSYIPLRCNLKDTGNKGPGNASMPNNSRFHPYGNPHQPSNQNPHQHPPQNPNQARAPAQSPRPSRFSSQSRFGEQPQYSHNMPPATPTPSYNNMGYQQPDYASTQGYSNNFGSSPQPLMNAMEQPKSQGPFAIYVGGLPETSCKNCLLYQLFAPYGCIISVKAMEGRSKEGETKTTHWYGFINYKDQEGAVLACQTLDKSTLDGQVLKVTLKSEKPGFNNRNENRFTRNQPNRPNLHSH